MPHLAAARRAPAVDRGRAETRLFIAPYADETVSDIKVLFDAHGRVRYADKRPSERCVDGYLWQRWEGTQTGGQRWAEHHPERQRHVMRQPPRCGGCSGEADMNERGMLWLLNANASTGQLAFLRDIITASPPMCVPDAHQALRLCRVLREGFIALRVQVAEPIGVKGTIYSPSAPPQDDQLILFDDSRMDRVVARQVILKLYDAEQDTTTLRPETVRGTTALTLATHWSAGAMAEPDQEQQTVRFGHAWLTYTQRRPHTVLTLGGEFFVYEAPSLRTHLAQAIGEDDGDLILVTRDVSYFDSTCIGALIGSLQQLVQSPGRRRAVRIGDSGVMAKILRLTGLLNVIDLHSTIAEAQQAAAARAAPV